VTQRGRRWLPLAGAVLVLGALQARAADASSAAVVEQPRAFGRVIGDVLTQRVLVGSEELAALPSAGRVGAWFERRAPRIETDVDGRKWLLLEHQLVNSPLQPRVVSLPALALNLRGGGALQVPAWPVSIGPLVPRLERSEGALQPLQPERDVPAVALEPIRRRLELALGFGVTGLVLWLGWWAWRNRRDAVRLPFARAWQTMRAQPGDGADAWRSLHRAVDETAGQVVKLGTLPVLWQRAPHLQALEPRVEAFYRRSADRFFATVPGDETYPVHALCRDLRDLERRHHRGR
jgi:mxaA protein